jgi:GTP-binding protein
MAERSGRSTFAASGLGAAHQARPPTFVLFCSRPKALPDSYVRYLVNSLRETFDLPGVPIRLHLRKGENPYAAKTTH